MRFGIISEVQGCKAKVKLAENLVTDFLPVLQFANSYKKKWEPIRPGEQCFVLSNLGDVNAGLIIRGIYYTSYPAPSTDTNTQKTVYEDGTEITYTPSTKTLNITGDVNITISGNANITVQNADITAQSIKAQASSAELTCPDTTVTGNINVVGTVTAVGVIGTTVTVGGAGGSELKSEGGKFSIDRPLDVKGDVKSSGLVYDKFGAIRTQYLGGGGS